jgi:D-beta-D-heptose 7-phosphate kinase/D-beta-D-heptose 1-phosphate adenosyltransferase
MLVLQTCGRLAFDGYEVVFAKLIGMAMLKKWVELFSRQTVLVVGDLMLDHYIWGAVSRISPEAPVPVVNVSSESIRFGGAGNVLHNILTLGGKGIIAGVVGSDNAGKWIAHELASRGVPCEGILLDADRPTTQKTRIIAHHQQVVRYDHEKIAPLPSKTEKGLIDFVVGAIPGVNGIILSDYAKGVVTPRLIKTLLPIAKKRGVPVLVDPKVGHFPSYKNVTLITPNHLEATQATGIAIRDEQTLLAAGAWLLKKMVCEAILITRGEAGMSLFERGGKVTHIPTEAKDVFDVTGAGDTVIGTLALGLCAGAPLVDAARLANCAAGLAVGIVGTAAIEKEMLKQALP